MSKVRKELLLDTNNNLERPKCIKKKWEVKWRGGERILCEPVRDVGAMHDFDNSFLSPCPRDIRAKDRTGSTEAFRGSLYIREKSMILIVIVATPVYLRVEEGCNRETTLIGISIARYWLQHATNTVEEMIGKPFDTPTTKFMNISIMELETFRILAISQFPPSSSI